MSVETNLSALTELAGRQREQSDQLTQVVRDLRSAGVSWTKIGAALGTSRQAAWRKYEGMTREEGEQNASPVVDTGVPSISTPEG